MRVSNLWPALAGLTMLVAACGGDRSRKASTQGDTAAPAVTPVPAADTAMPAPPDTGTPVTPADTTTVAARQRPSDSGAKRPSQKPAPAPAPAKQDSNRPKPNIDPGRTRQPPAVPSSAMGQGQDTSAPAPLRDAYHQAPRDTVSQAVYNGWKQFNLNCARCHGEDVQGTTIAPHLVESLKPDGPINTKELFIQTVCKGRPEKGMPAWCSLGLDTATIEQLYAYVKGRSDGKVHLGRPAVR